MFLKKSFCILVVHQKFKLLKMGDQKIHVIVRDRTQTLYNGTATGVTSKNTKGVFDILHNHSNFISLINETLLIHREQAPDISIPMNNAIVKVKENNVEVYVGVKK